MISVESTNLDQSNITLYHHSSTCTVSSSGDRCLFHLVPFLPSHHVIQGGLSRPFHLSPHLGRRGLVTHYVH